MSSDYRAVLFKEDTELLAYALFRDQEPGDVYLRQFFVVRHRRRQGIGRRALRILRDEVFKGKRVVLDVLTHNRTAHSFWIAVGFRDYATVLEQLPEPED